MANCDSDLLAWSGSRPCWKISSHQKKIVWLCPICLLGIIPGLCCSPDCVQKLSVGVLVGMGQNCGKVWDTCQASRQDRYRTVLELKFWMSLIYWYRSSQKDYLWKYYKVVYPSWLRAYLSYSNTEFWSSEYCFKYTLPKMSVNKLAHSTDQG